MFDNWRSPGPWAAPSALRVDPLPRAEPTQASLAVFNTIGEGASSSEIPRERVIVWVSKAGGLVRDRFGQVTVRKGLRVVSIFELPDPHSVSNVPKLTIFDVINQ